MLRSIPLDDRGDRFRDRGVELGPGTVIELGEGLADGERGAVGTVGDHGVECVATGDDAGLQRDLLASKPIRIARPVPALVGRADDPRYAVEQPTDLEQ